MSTPEEDEIPYAEVVPEPARPVRSVRSRPDSARTDWIHDVTKQIEKDSYRWGGTCPQSIFIHNYVEDLVVEIIRRDNEGSVNKLPETQVIRAPTNKDTEIWAMSFTRPHLNIYLKGKLILETDLVVDKVSRHLAVKYVGGKYYLE
jgi:hypothetical protein